MHKSQSLFNLITALHVLGVTITHLQEHKKTASTASGNNYPVINRVTFIDKEYRYTRLKLQLLDNVYSAVNALSSIE
jgi:outer membrane receptor for Fe3+-dicitrate